MKKTLLYVAAMLTLVMTVSFWAVGVFAEGETLEAYEIPLESMEVVESTRVKLIENYIGYWDEWFNPQTQQYESCFIYDLYPMFRELEVKLTFADGTVEYAGLWDIVNGHEFYGYDNQDVSPWVIGGNNIYTIKFMDKSIELLVEVCETPVESLEVLGELTPLIETDDLIERYYYDDDFNEIVYMAYNEDRALENCVLKVNYKDGTYREIDFYSNLPEAYTVSLKSDQYNTPWTIGGNNTITITYMDVSVQVNAVLKERPVKNVEIAEDTIPVLMENCNGYWDQKYNEETGEFERFFVYEPSLSGAKATAQFSDGRVSPIYIHGYSMGTNQYEEPWGVGKHTVTVTVYFFEGDGESKPEEDVEDYQFTLDVDFTVVESPVESFSIVEGTLGALYENVGGGIGYDYNEETGETEEYYVYNVEGMLYEGLFEVGFKDGSSRVYTYEDLYVENLYFYYIDTQDKKHWTVGTNNQLTLVCMGVECVVNVEVKESPIKSVEVVEGTVKDLIENCDGNWEVRYNEETESEESFFWYFISEAVSEAKYKVTYNDGTSEIITADNYSTSSDQYEQPWTVGSNVMYVDVYVKPIGEIRVEVQVNVVESPVESIEIVEGTVTSLIENTGGSYEAKYDQESGEEIIFFHYSYGYAIGNMKLKVNFKDGTSKIVKFDQELDGYNIECRDYQEIAPWTIGGANELDVGFMGVKTTVNVEIKPSNVASVDIIEDTLTPVTHKVDCDVNWYYDEETGDKVYRYYYGYGNILKNAKFKITYKDGTEEVLSYRKIEDAYGFDAWLNQDEQWSVGGNNLLTVSYFGATDSVSVEMLPNPVQKIEVVEGSCVPLIKDCYGYFDISYADGEEFFYYHVDPIVNSVKIKVYYTDGTTEILTNSSLNGRDQYIGCGEGQYGQPWTVGGDNVITLSYMGSYCEYVVEIIESPVEKITVNSADYGRIVYGDREKGYINDEGGYVLYTHPNTLDFTVEFKDGSSVNYTYDSEKDDIFLFGFYDATIQCPEEGVAVGSNIMTFSYMGVETTFTVEVEACPVESIKMIKAPASTDILVKNSEYSYAAILPVFDGIDFEIKFKDGRVIKASEAAEEVDYITFEDEYIYAMLIGDYYLYVGRFGDDGALTAHYMGVDCDLSNDFAIVEGKAISSVAVDKYTVDGDGMVVTLTYEDGSFETLTFEVLDYEFEEESGAVCGVAKCHKGTFMYYVQEYEGFRRVYVFGCLVEWEIEEENDENVIPGDADGNGEIDSDDAIHLLYNVLFGDDYALSQECDFDGSGAVDSDDAIYLLYHVLFGAADYPLK